MAVSSRKRFEVFKRDKFACQYCGRNPPTVVLHCDHIVPQSEFGSDDMLNLITSCMDCNLGKSNVSLGQVTKPIAEQMREAAERKQQVTAYNQFLLSMREDEDAEIEELGLYWHNLYVSEIDANKYLFGEARVPSIRAFLKSLPQAVVMEAMDISAKVPASLNRDESRWKYFCKVCWNKVREEDRQ